MNLKINYIREYEGCEKVGSISVKWLGGKLFVCGMCWVFRFQSGFLFYRVG